MSRRKVEQFSSTHEINPENWPSVLEDALSPGERELYLQEGESGLFQLFLANNPTIKNYIDEWFLNRFS